MAKQGQGPVPDADIPGLLGISQAPRPAPGDEPLACGCPGSAAMSFDEAPAAPARTAPAQTAPAQTAQASQLGHWPVQLHLVSPAAPYFQGRDVLLSADCVAYSVGDFHEKWLAGRSLAIACPKLDSNLESYMEKLVALIDEAKVNTLTVMTMEVPCCGGLLRMVQEASARAERRVPIRHVHVGVRGDILSDDWLAM